MVPAFRSAKGHQARRGDRRDDGYPDRKDLCDGADQQQPDDTMSSSTICGS